MGKKCNIAFLSTKTINFNQEPDRNNNCNTCAIKNSKGNFSNFVLRGEYFNVLWHLPVGDGY